MKPITVSTPFQLYKVVSDIKDPEKVPEDRLIAMIEGLQMLRPKRPVFRYYMLEDEWRHPENIFEMMSYVCWDELEFRRNPSDASLEPILFGYAPKEDEDPTGYDKEKDDRDRARAFSRIPERLVT